MRRQATRRIVAGVSILDVPDEKQAPLIQTQTDGAIACYLDEPPSANRWWRNVRGRMVLSREAREYKAMVALLGQASRAKPFPKGTAVRFQMHWHRGRKSGDLDKRLGVLLDALQGVAYENDSQIVEIAATRDDVPYAFAVVVHVTAAHHRRARAEHGNATPRTEE